MYEPIDSVSPNQRARSAFCHSLPLDISGGVCSGLRESNPVTSRTLGLLRWSVELVNSKFLIAVGHEVAFTVNDDRGAFDPLGAVL